MFEEIGRCSNNLFAEIVPVSCWHPYTSTPFRRYTGGTHTRVLSIQEAPGWHPYASTLFRRYPGGTCMRVLYSGGTQVAPICEYCIQEVPGWHPYASTLCRRYPGGTRTRVLYSTFSVNHSKMLKLRFCTYFIGTVTIIDQLDFRA